MIEYQIEWLVPGTVLFVRKVGAETLDSLREGNEKVFARIQKSGKPPVHVIVDPRQMTGYPDIRQAQDEFNRLLKHPSVGWAVFTDGARLSAARKLIGTVLTRLEGIHWKSVNSVEEGLVFLRSKEARLAGLDTAAAARKAA